MCVSKLFIGRHSNHIHSIGVGDVETSHLIYESNYNCRNIVCASHQNTLQPDWIVLIDRFSIEIAVVIGYFVLFFFCLLLPQKKTHKQFRATICNLLCVLFFTLYFHFLSFYFILYVSSLIDSSQRYCFFWHFFFGLYLAYVVIGVLQEFCCCCFLFSFDSISFFLLLFWFFSF